MNRSSGSMSAKSGSLPGGSAAQTMVSAEERQALKEQRRTSLTPAAAALNAPAEAGEAVQAEVGRFNSLQSKLALTDIQGDLADMENAVNALPANLAHIRARGYVFKNYLEKKIETLATQWRDLRPRVEAALRTQQPALQREAAAVQATLSRGALAGPALPTLESKVEAALSSLHGMYDPLDDNVNQAQRQIDDVAWTLQQAEQASFTFLAGEAPVEAVPANWKKPDNKDGVGGVLYLTDQRLVFEQKEEVVTKKVLFVATEKQKLQSLQWAVPVAEIEKVIGAKRGFMGKDDFLTLTLTTSQPFHTTDLHLMGETGEAWQGFIGRVKSGDVAQERTVLADPKAAETVAKAPTKCSVCGATLTQTILRGQTEITCEYCGSKIRL